MGIWENAGALLGSVTVTTDGALLDGFHYVAAPPISLVAGSTYVIGGLNRTSGDAVLQQGFGYSSLVTASQITYQGARSGSGGSLSRPDTSPVGGGHFGPNFQFVVMAVPEPGTALFSLALAATMALRRQR